jgi:hypothetical protein
LCGAGRDKSYRVVFLSAKLWHTRSRAASRPCVVGVTRLYRQGELRTIYTQPLMGSRIVPNAALVHHRHQTEKPGIVHQTDTSSHGEPQTCPCHLHPMLGRTGSRPRDVVGPAIVMRRFFASLMDASLAGLDSLASRRTLPPRFILLAWPGVKALSARISGGEQLMGGLRRRSALFRR